MSQGLISEGIVSQLKKMIGDSMPMELSIMCDNVKKLRMEDEVSRIVEDYMVVKTNLDGVYIEKIKLPDSDITKKFIKKKKYHIDKLMDELQNEYESAMSGVPVLSSSSPYNESALVIMRTTARLQRTAAIDAAKQMVDDYFEKLKDIPLIRRGVDGFIGFYEYPFFLLLCAGDQKRAIKLLKIDIEEYVFRLAFSKNYENFVYYPAESVGKAFYGETIRSKKVDTEYEVVSSQYLKDTFFPKEIGVKQVSIDAKKPWDDRDSRLFSYLCTKCVTERSDGKNVLTVDGNIRELCKTLFPEANSYSSKFYTLARNRLLNLGRTSIVAVLENGVIISRNIFEQTIVDSHDNTNGEKSNGALYHVEFGRNVSADILSHRLSTIIKPRLDELVNPVSRFLYVQLKKDRTMDLYLSGEKTTHQYTLIWLMLIFRVRDAKKDARIARYSEALEEMKEKKLLIKKFKVFDERFEIEWIPLSEDEKMDIKVLHGDQHILESNEG